MHNTSALYTSVTDIADDAPILLKWRYINGFTLFVMLDHRQAIAPFSSVQCRTTAEYEEMWTNLSEMNRKDFCRRAKLLRDEIDEEKVKQLMHLKPIVRQQPDSDEISLLGTQMLHRDVSRSYTRLMK